jgi:DNA helicase-2/ATP-dependent DNA helicase PcrA
VDYKTGSVENAKEKMHRPNGKQPNGGDYWRQAAFYKILVDNFKRDWQVISTEFDFIEPDKKKEYCREKLYITPDDTEIVLEQITTVWEKIQNHDFYTGCGSKDCHWCNFSKTNNLTVALHDLQDEEVEVM